MIVFYKKINVNIIFNINVCFEGYRTDIWWFLTFLKPFVISQADRMQKFGSESGGICVFLLSVFCSEAFWKLKTNNQRTKASLKPDNLKF